ncbi:hypothetical protein [Alkalihalobacillus sp. BA299]|uniref:hypothetical protein n=1 Tax=Alkalihalobacillus sp. BA299 TaxID=2815938 RepID=UPI001ADAF0A0|nr:hypothetical protein [Alkalihalobacillus sp. BA299]
MEKLSKTCMDLLKLVEQQEQVITKQNETIARLVNETVEKEEMINELMQDYVEI